MHSIKFLLQIPAFISVLLVSCQNGNDTKVNNVVIRPGDSAKSQIDSTVFARFSNRIICDTSNCDSLTRQREVIMYLEEGLAIMKRYQSTYYFIANGKMIVPCNLPDCKFITPDTVLITGKIYFANHSESDAGNQMLLFSMNTKK